MIDAAGLEKDLQLSAKQVGVRLGRRACFEAIRKARNMVCYDRRAEMIPGEFEAMIVANALEALGVPDPERDVD